MNSEQKDNLFSKTVSPEKFEFNEPVARVFDDMLERSIPFYMECQEMAVQWTVRHVQNHTKIYDLGCSTGSFLERTAQGLTSGLDVQLIGLDNSAPMLEKTKARLDGSPYSWDLAEFDLNEGFTLANASVVALNYTLQFIDPGQRGGLLSTIFQGLVPGGCLILIEKVKAESPELDSSLIEFHHEFKRTRGYSNLEISRKREALENVLVPLKTSENVHLLEKAGFQSVEIFFKWNNFAGFIALK